MGRYNIYQADVIEWLRDYAQAIADGQAEPYHAIIGDTPYALISIAKRFGKPDSAKAQQGTDGVFKRLSKGFMGQGWDGFESLKHYQSWVTEWAELATQVVYPGGIALLYGGSRTQHRLAVGLEDAGWDIYDSIACWTYGGGMPKPYNYAKRLAHRQLSEDVIDNWRGYDFMLKPSYEPILVARAPRGGLSFVDCALRYGVGALNIGEMRVDPNGQRLRWPANTVYCHHPECENDRCHEDCHVLKLGQQSGMLKAGGNLTGGETWSVSKAYGDFPHRAPWSSYDDEGTAAMFFYTPKARGFERQIPSLLQIQSRLNDEENEQIIRERIGLLEQIDRLGVTPVISNHQGHAAYNPADIPSDLQRFFEIYTLSHPTLKPLALNEYLARLILPPETVGERRLLNLFSGVGSEMIGGLFAGWDVVDGVERDGDVYIPEARERLQWFMQFDSYEQARAAYGVARDSRVEFNRSLPPDDRQPSFF